MDKNKKHRKILNKNLKNLLLGAFLVLSLISSIPFPSLADGESNLGTNPSAEDIRDKFTDMANHWADSTVAMLVELNILDGYGDDSFKPDDTITRAEFAKVIRTSLELEVSKGNSFDDTNKNWAKDEINTLVLEDIIHEEEYGSNYEPNKNITRIEMAKMIVRALGLDEVAKENSGLDTSFIDNNDIKVSDRGYVLIASKNDIIKGYPDGRFKPNGQATRAEASQMIVNMFNALEKGLDTEGNNQVEITPPISKEEKIAHLYDYPAINFDGDEFNIVDLHNHFMNLGDDREMNGVYIDAKDIISLIHNRDYRNVPSDYETRLLYHIYGKWGYRDTIYHDGQFPRLWIDEMKNWKISSESEFLTNDDLVYRNINGRLAIRGVLRIRYNSHDNPSNIQYEISKKGEKLQVGKWYEADVDIEFGQPFSNVEREHSRFGFWARHYLSDFKEVK